MQLRLKKAGYATASIGKLHFWPPNVLEARRTGFDHVELHDGVSTLDRFSDYVRWQNENDPQAAAFPYRALATDIKPAKNPFRALPKPQTLDEIKRLPVPLQNQGQSVAPLIAESNRNYMPREAVFCENVIPEVITSRAWDFSFEKGRGVKGVRHPDAKMVRTRRWKYNDYPAVYAELYDLKNDPQETRNLHGDAKFREVEQAMKNRLLHWLVTASETDQIAPQWLSP